MKEFDDAELVERGFWTLFAEKAENDKRVPKSRLGTILARIRQAVFQKF